MVDIKSAGMHYGRIVKEAIQVGGAGTLIASLLPAMDMP